MSKKIALIFGGSRGIGAAAVQSFIKDGFDVAYTYVTNAPDAGQMDSTQNVKAYKVDITDPVQVEEVFASVTADFGAAPTCVVANAGINVPPAPMADFDPANFRRLVEVNVVGAFNILTQAARNVADNGSIIAVSTSMVRFAVPGGGPYTASKAAVESLVRSMSKELAGRGVRVNAVAPGPVDTDLFRSGKNDVALKNSAAISPLNRVGETKEIAEVISFLASDKASWILGQVVQPNGGMV